VRTCTRLLTVVAALLLLGAAAAFASGGKGESAAPAAKPMMEISFANWDIANSFPADKADPMKAYFEDKFKITIKPVAVTWGDADEKLNIWAASGQLPDVIGAIATVGDGRYFQWIQDKVIRALPADLSAYPNVSKYVKIPEVKAYDVDGKTYVLPRMTYEDSSWWCMDRGIIARADWMQKLKISEPATKDDFIRMCVRFAKEDPDGNGKDDTVGVTPVGVWIFYSQCFTNYGFTDHRWIKDTDGKYRLGDTTRGALELMKFIRELYQKGGLDPDFATNAADGSTARNAFAGGRAGVLLRQVSPKHMNILATDWAKLQPDKPFTQNVKILHPFPVAGKNYEIFVEKAYWSESYINSAVDDAKLKRILELYDYMYSKEGILFTQYGFLGQDYKMVNGEVSLLKKNADGKPAIGGDLYPLSAGGFNYMVVWPGDLLQYVDPSIPKAIRDVTVAERDYRLANWKKPAIDWQVQAINVPEKQAMTIDVGADWTQFIRDTSGKSEEEMYQAMLAKWKANGYDATVEAVTAAAKKMGK